MKEGRRVCGEGCGNATNLGYKLQRKQEEKRTSSKNWKKKKRRDKRGGRVGKCKGGSRLKLA
jgi:hypothetical protein